MRRLLHGLTWAWYGGAKSSTTNFAALSTCCLSSLICPSVRFFPDERTSPAMMIEQLSQPSASERPSGQFSLASSPSTNLVLATGGPAAAVDLKAAQEALALVENSDQITAWSEALVVLAEAESRAGHTVDAEMHVRDAIDLRQTAGDEATIPVGWFLTAARLALKRRDPKLALWTYEIGLQSIRAQEQRGADISSWGRNEALLRLRIGELHLAQQDLSRAREEAKRAHEVLWAATQLPVDDVTAVDGLFRSLIELGGFQRKCHDIVAAASSFQTAVELGRDMVLRSGQTIDKHRALSFALNRWAESLVETGDSDAALAAYTEALEIRRQLRQMLPNDEVIAKDLSSALRKVARLLHLRGNTAVAVQTLRESIVLDEDRAQQLGSADVGLARMLALSYGQLAQWTEPGEQALEWATRGIQIASELDQVHDAKDLRRHTLLIRADIFRKLGDLQSAADDETHVEILTPN